jgi:hypothetical protein
VVHPPNRGRRRQIRRALAFVAVVFALFGATGFVFWKNTRFPARSERIAGIPVLLRVQDGVKPNELRAIRDGIRLTDRYMKRALGRTVHGPVEVRVARANGCHSWEPAGAGLVGEGQDGFVCVDTATPAWQWIIRKDHLEATAMAGHEYVHVLQGELGCLPPPRNQQYRWILEGMATETAWRALAASGRATRARIERTIIRDGAFDPNLEALSAYERDTGRDAEYALWHLAVRKLLTAAVADGAAPASRPEIALRHFCARVGQGRPWRWAFARSFGLSLPRFYASFETARQRGGLVPRAELHRYAHWIW